MAHELPSADHLSDFTGFFKTARFNRDGGADVTFSLGPNQLAALLDLQTNDGLALNVSVWGTTLSDGDDDLAELLSLLEGHEDD